MDPLADLPDRIRRKITIDSNDCWNWEGSRTNSYGHVRMGDKVKRAHRVLYELLVGPIPTGLHLDHLCRNRSCVNPAHLEPVTQRENTLRSPTALAACEARRTHCPQGHPYDDANTLTWKRKRYCRICTRRNVRESMRRKRAAAKH